MLKIVALGMVVYVVAVSYKKQIGQFMVGVAITNGYRNSRFWWE